MVKAISLIVKAIPDFNFMKYIKMVGKVSVLILIMGVLIWGVFQIKGKGDPIHQTKNVFMWNEEEIEFFLKMLEGDYLVRYEKMLKELSEDLKNRKGVSSFYSVGVGLLVLLLLTLVVGKNQEKWVETKESFLVLVELPGLSKEKIKMAVKDDLLLIESRNPMENHKILKKMKLPSAKIKIQEINGKMKDGILTILIPKDEEVVEMEILIE